MAERRLSFTDLMSEHSEPPKTGASAGDDWADFGFDPLFTGETPKPVIQKAKTLPTKAAPAPAVQGKSTVATSSSSSKSHHSRSQSTLPTATKSPSSSSSSSSSSSKTHTRRSSFGSSSDVSASPSPSGDSPLSSPGSDKKEAKKKCAVKGCKNRRFKRKYCAMHLGSEFDREKDQDEKTPSKSVDDWSVSRTVQSGAYFKKNVMTWRFVYKGEKHTVVLKHSPVGGKRVIIVDGSRVYSDKLAGSSRHPLNIGSSDATRVPCAVLIKQGISGVEYDLEIKGGSFADAQHIWINSTEDI